MGKAGIGAFLAGRDQRYDAETVSPGDALYNKSYVYIDRQCGPGRDWKWDEAAHACAWVTGQASRERAPLALWLLLLAL